MRLLKSDQNGDVTFTKDLSEAELSNPEYKYAILSHTWGKDEEEVSYKDILDGVGIIKAGAGSCKIRFCLRQARQDGLKYFWVDTCCIDKTSAAELSKSLISMFRWYSNAEKCYVFLTDVPSTERSKEEWSDDFRFCRWFRRGWTLQELIAPRTVEFYNKNGVMLGTKSSLERQINEITRIPINVLHRQVLDFTVHDWRQWQEGRQTREPEDMVYSLLGILEIAMPALYGEGAGPALRRLEIELNNKLKGG